MIEATKTEATKDAKIAPPAPGMRKIKLLKEGYGGIPYPEGSIVEASETEGTFIVQSGHAIWAPDDAEVTPVPTGPSVSKTKAERQAAYEKAKAEEDKAAIAKAQAPKIEVPASPDKGHKK